MGDRDVSDADAVLTFSANDGRCNIPLIGPPTSEFPREWPFRGPSTLAINVGRCRFESNGASSDGLLNDVPVEVI